MVKKQERGYDDSYPTCVETYSTLRIFSDDLDPAEITRILEIEPTHSYRKGDLHALGKLRRTINAWFYSTEKLTDSKDGRRHLDLILNALEGKAIAWQSLQAQGCESDITTYWLSAGQGGPWLMPAQMRKLGALEIDVWWDIYFECEKKSPD